MSWARRPHGGADAGWRPPTTFVDVLFLVLTFFLTITSFRENDRQIDVSLPATDTKRSDDPHTPIIITVTSTGAVFMGQKEYDLPSLKATLGGLVSQYPNEAVVIRGDKDSKLGTAVQVMDMAYSVGLKNVLLATTKAGSGL